MPEGVLLRPAAANTSKEKPLPQRPNTASSSDATETAGSPFSWTRSETDGHPSNNAAAEVHVVEHAPDAAAAGATAQPAPAEANAHNEAADGANDSSSSTLAPRPPGRRVPRSTLRGGGAAVTAISPRLNDNAYDAQTVSSSTVDATLHNSQSITTMGGRGAIEASFPSVGRNTNGGGSRPRDRIRSAASLREAVTTNLDRYAVFEKELLEEINLLRRAPNAYAALLEQQATLGYPFIHGDDVYFDADAIAETVHRPPVLPMSELLPEVSETPPPRGRASKKRPLTGGSSRDFQESPRSSSVEEGHLASAGGVDGCGTGEAATLKSLGMEQLNLVQLRTHFLRHQKRRMALEKALKEVMSQWQQAEQMQHDTWAAEDEKANKKKRATKDRKKSVCAPEDVYFARRTASEKLNTNYQSAVAVLAEDLRRTRATCRRTLQGANLILDCIRALKEARPAPPLRLSRGLTLASRDASRSYHCEIERVKALTEKHEQLLSSTMLGQFGQQAATTGSVAMYSGSQAIRATSLNISDGNLMHHGSLRGMSREVSAQDAAQAAATLASAETRERSGAEAMHLPDVAEGHHGSHEYAGFVEELLGDIHDLERSSRQTCADYGYVSGEVRGLQLYGVGSPRSLVMQMLLGVVTPVFSFTDKKSGGTMPPGMSYSFLSPSSASSPCSQMSRPNHGNSITDTCFEESMFNLHTSLTDDGRGEGVVPGQLTQLDSLIVTPPPALCGPPTKSITGLRYGGMYHPSSAAASAYMGAEEAKETTSAGKRAAKAVQRLGPLLWRDAHLFGCGWQRVFGELQTPTYQEHCLDTPYQLPIPPEDLNQVRVSTLVMVASGYEELDLIHQRKNFTLDEVRRMVHQDVARPGQEPQRSLRTSQSPRESVADSDCLVSHADAFHTKMDRPAVVDLHSSLDVTLLFPTSHPLIVPHGQSTVWIGLRADAQRVQLRACVSAVSEPLPTSPFLSSEEVLVQRSETDINVVVVLVDLRAAFARTQGNPLLINLYEMDKLANGEQGFEHIGFLRVVDAPPSGPVRSPGLPRHQRRSEDFPVSSRRQLRSAHSNATGATVEDTLPADLTDTKAALMADAPPDLRQLIRSLDFSSRPCSKPILSVADARKLPTLPASRGLTSGPTSAEAAMGSSLLPAAGGSPALYGWPAISQDFYDRCGTLLAPLCASLSPTDERRSIRVFLPLSEDYLEMQMESLRAVLEELRQVEAKELAEDEAEQIAEEQAAMAPPPTDSVDSGEEEESPMGSQLTGKDTKGKKDGKGHKASKAEAKKKAARRQSSVAKDKELRRTSFFTQAERDVRANLLLLPMSTLAPDFNERMSLRKLRSISEALHNDALVSRAQYTRAEDVLKSELSRLEKDLPKKKGKELLRLKHDEEDITRELEEMREKVEGVEAAALRASDEVLRRERNIALRKARILRTQAELSRLVAQTDRRVPLSVCLWFAGGTSVLPSSLSVKPIAAQMAEQDCKKTVVVDVLPPRHRRARSPPDVLVFGDSTGVSSSIMGDRNRSASSDTGFTKGLTAMGCSGTSIRSDSGAKSATRGPEDQRSMLETERFDDGQAGRIDTVRGTDTQDLSLSGRGVALPRIHRERNVVVLTATNSDLTLYEAEFTVPSGFNGRAVLLVEDQETISWMVSSE